MGNQINILEKTIRSEVIKEHMEALGIKKAVVFTCGNSAKFLRAAGVEVLAIGKDEELRPQKWFTQREIAKQFPDHFNATSGDIPLFLIEEIGRRLKEELGEGFEGGEVKVGSGETLLALTIAYPELRSRIKPYRDETPETAFDPEATLNATLKAIYSEKLWEKN